MHAEVLPLRSPWHDLREEQLSNTDAKTYKWPFHRHDVSASLGRNNADTKKWKQKLEQVY